MMNINNRIVEEYSAIAVPDAPLSEDAIRTCAARKGRMTPVQRWRRGGKVLLEACLVLILGAIVALVFSRDAREFAVSFFRPEPTAVPAASPSPTPSPSTPAVTEEMPAPTPAVGLRLFEVQETTDAEIYTYVNDGYMVIYENLICSWGQEGTFQVFRREGETLTELELQRVDDVIQVGGLELGLHFWYTRENGELMLFEDRSFEELTVDGWISSLVGSGENTVWISAAVRSPVDVMTCILYDLDTGEKRDILGEAGIKLTCNDYVSFSPDRNHVLTMTAEKTYWVEIASGQVRELTDINGSDSFGVAVIDNETLSVARNKSGEHPADTPYTISRFDIASGEQTVLLVDVPFYNPISGSYTGYRGLGQGMYLLVDADGYSLMDAKDGTVYTIEGIAPDSNTYFSLSPDRSSILINKTGGSDSAGWVTLMGVFRWERGVLETFDQPEFTIQGWPSVFMNARDQAVAIAHDDEYRVHTCYVYNLR